MQRPTIISPALLTQANRREFGGTGQSVHIANFPPHRVICTLPSNKIIYLNIPVSADPILYCLERLSDYRDFERFANDLMIGLGYPNLEPLGGSSDGGRDALHIDRHNGRTTIFAYSARADWETKFRSDCKRISQLDHQPDEIVFVSTREISADKKDTQRTITKRDYGWEVDFYDCERLRVQLTGPQSTLLARHPAIFVPPWFERRGGELVGHSVRDLVVIDHLARIRHQQTGLWANSLAVDLLVIK